MERTGNAFPTFFSMLLSSSSFIAFIILLCLSNDRAVYPTILSSSSSFYIHWTFLGLLLLLLLLPLLMNPMKRPNHLHFLRLFNAMNTIRRVKGRVTQQPRRRRGGRHIVLKIPTKEKHSVAGKCTRFDFVFHLAWTLL
jgi:hypothetical protein